MIKNTKIMAFVLLSLGTLVVAQTKEQIEQIKQKTDTTALKLLKNLFEKEQMNEEQLKAKAKQLNIEYRYEHNGVTYQLNGFDANGLPIYYRTFGEKSDKKSTKKCCLPTSRLERIKKGKKK